MKTHEEEEEVDVDSITVSLFVNVLENPNLTMKQAGSSQVIIFSQSQVLYIVCTFKVGNGISICFLEQGQQHQTVGEDVLRKIRAKVLMVWEQYWLRVSTFKRQNYFMKGKPPNLKQNKFKCK